MAIIPSFASPNGSRLYYCRYCYRITLDLLGDPGTGWTLACRQGAAIIDTPRVLMWDKRMVKYRDTSTTNVWIDLPRREHGQES